MLNKRYTIFFSALLLLGGLGAQAQNTTSSPYSQFGLGQMQRNGSIIQLGMGGISNGLRPDNAINTHNPASYNAISLTTFEVGAFGTFISMKSDGGSAQGNNAALSYLKLAFPISDRWGASVGLVPLSGVGYESRIPATFADTPVTQVFKGSGGLNQFYVGNSYRIYKGLSLGLNVTYLFGTIERTKANEFPDSLNFENIKQTHSTYIGSFFINYGIQYKHDLSGDRYLTLGISGNPSSKMNAIRNTLGIRYLYGSFNNQVVVDTVQNTFDEKGKVVFPMINSFGFTYGKKNHWLVGADLNLGNWSALEIYGQKQGLKNTMDVAIGGSYTPSYNAVGNYLKTVEYRLGFNYTQSYISINGQDINQMNLSVGLGLPLPKSKSMVNLALELGKRGTTASSLIQEEYIGVHAGFNFCDKWFTKRKYE